MAPSNARAPGGVLPACSIRVHPMIGRLFDGSFSWLWRAALLDLALHFGPAPVLAQTAQASEQTPAAEWLSPTATVASADGKMLYLACATGSRIAAVDLTSGRIVRTIPLPAAPSGLVLAGGTRLYVTCAAAESGICEVDPEKGDVPRSWKGRHTPTSPVLSPDQRTLYICNRFSSSVSIYDVANGKERACIPVRREPISAALTMDGHFLFVAHHLPNGRADAATVAASVTLIDLSSRQVVKELPLPNGSSLLREIRISPDGAYAAVVHNLARFQMPTTQLERGWMNTSALTLIDTRQQRIVNTVLLDDLVRGAANPWALAWSADGQTLCISHAGTHEVSLVRFPELLAKLAKLPTARSGGGNGYSEPLTAADVPNDLAFLVGLRERVRLKGNGPRSLAMVGDRVYAANYFSDTLEAVSLEHKTTIGCAIPLHAPIRPDELRQGEMFFNDATLCFQEWQSCATCHSEDARVDGLNWDLLNDGIGNPKNTKSLLLAHRTPPAMSTGIRETAETAVRAGLQHILFSVQPARVANALDAWLKSLQPMPSPFLEHGKLSTAARRGQRLFQSAKVGCAGCHPAELWTNQSHYDVGTSTPMDQGAVLFDTPALVEVWRTAPYLHDGSAATLRDVLTSRNVDDRHGRTSHLSSEQTDDLVHFLLSL